MRRRKTGDAASMGREEGIVYKFSMRKPHARRLLWIYNIKLEDNIKINLREVYCYRNRFDATDSG
jgi:hypothetical protein